MWNVLDAPWRSDYTAKKRVGKCVFCHISQNAQQDQYQYVLYRDERCFIVMNKYPYTPGHFMIIPHLHTDKLEELPQETWVHINILAQQGVKLLKEELGAQGVNIGMNLGKSAGAGIAEHIHLHLVPRWEKDTNFITTIANTRVHSKDFEQLYTKLKSLVALYFHAKKKKD